MKKKPIEIPVFLFFHWTLFGPNFPTKITPTFLFFVDFQWNMLGDSINTNNLCCNSVYILKKISNLSKKLFWAQFAQKKGHYGPHSKWNFLFYQNIICFGCFLSKKCHLWAESIIKKNSVSPINIELENYSAEHTPTEIAAGLALHQQKAILSSKKWFKYLYASQIRIYFYWNCMSKISLLDTFTNSHLYKWIILQTMLYCHCQKSLTKKTQRKFLFLVILA